MILLTRQVPPDHLGGDPLDEIHVEVHPLARTLVLAVSRHHHFKIRCGKTFVKR